MLEAQRQLRTIIGVGHLAKLTLAVERDVAARRAANTSQHRHVDPHRVGRYARDRTLITGSPP